MPASFTLPWTTRGALILRPVTRLEAAVEAMQRAGVIRATVFDGHRLHGTVSREDIRWFRAHQPTAAPPATVADAMPRPLDFGYDLDHVPPLLVERGGD